MLLRLACLLLLLSTLPLQAAEPDDSAPAANAEGSADDDSANAAIEAEDPALAEEIRQAEAAAANAPPADPNEPFVPSVQISEDLSVAFPVDI